ncbi:MAG TPA: hypothetical protein VLE99_01150 [Candidatus Saccharimonadales bacterium]|nr:hypothetical protein [Candidatus Saccharimonadales bacterium]
MRLSYAKYSVARGVYKVRTKTAIVLSTVGLLIGSGGGLALATLGSASADSAAINFETSQGYTLGNINGQQGWSATGSAGAGCAMYDEGVAGSMGISGFGAQSFRISNAVTSGCFGDQAFAPALSQPAGEPNALDKNGNPVASPQPHFEAQFSIASTTGAQQPGMAMSVSPDGGSGARMSYLRFEDHSDGMHVFFDDVTDPTHAVNADTFNETDVATLSYTAPHTVKFVMDFASGPDNDVVKVYIDGNLVKTGTSWEDYYLFDTESNPIPQNNNSRVVSTLLFREGGTAVPANAGNGYLIDNTSLISGATPVNLPTSKDQCMGSGWKSYGTTFKNQGDCVSFVATGGKNQPNGH